MAACVTFSTPLQRGVHTISFLKCYILLDTYGYVCMRICCIAIVKDRPGIQIFYPSKARNKRAESFQPEMGQIGELFEREGGKALDGEERRQFSRQECYLLSLFPLIRFSR